MSEQRLELARITLSVIFIAGLIAGSLWVLSPFVAAFIWATMIVVATWPFMLRVQNLLAGKRSLAVVVMTLLLLAIFVLPVGAGFKSVLSHRDALSGFKERLDSVEVPPAPAWVGGVPLVGEQVRESWNKLSATGLSEVAARAEPHAREAMAWLARKAGGLALLTVQFLLVVILSAVLYSGGEAWARWARGFGRRLAFEPGERMVVLAGQAIRGVAMGVVVTAVVQSALGGIGLAMVGVPYAGALTAVMFVLCIAQIGPILVLLAATAWAYLQLGAAWGSIMLGIALVVGLMDNFLRPVLIRRGADLPLLLIFAGVVGGLLTFGVIGIFVGPVVLAVAYTLVDDWVESGRAATEPAQATTDHGVENPATARASAAVGASRGV